MVLPGHLSRTLVELADTLVADFDVVELLTLLTDRSVQLLQVDAAGLMLVAPEGDLRVMASSSEAMRMLELFELQSHEGPCLDAYHTGAAVVNNKLADSHRRWPRFAPEALAAGFLSVHAVPMRLRGAVIGSLNMFNTNDRPLSVEDVDGAQALADIATIALLQHSAAAQAQVLNEQLSHALNSRVVIEQAKGVISERAGLDMEHAFNAMRGYSRDHNLRLADVARGVISGTLNPAVLHRPTRNGPT